MPKIRTPTLASPVSFADLKFPLCGIDISKSFSEQPARPFGGDQFTGMTPTGPTYSRLYGATTPYGQNVRSYEPVTDRSRGGQRAGLYRYIDATVSGAHLIQGMGVCVGVGYTAPGGNVQTSQSGRIVTLVVVSQGNVLVADAGETVWTPAIGGTAALITSGIVFSTVNNQKLWFADGTNWKYYDPATNTVSTWAATVGTLPVDSAGNLPRLICTWRGRIVLSGLIKDPQNLFMSRVAEPTDFNYNPIPTDPTQAVAFNSSPLGLIGDVVTSLIPFSDDVLFIGGDHTLWMVQGDPMNGGQVNRVSDAIGTAWGTPWCKDPYGNIYFVSNRMGIYSLTPGSAPQRISQQIEQLLQVVNTGSKTISLVWDDRFQGLHVFVTSTAGPAADTHFFWEMRVAAWWVDKFANNNHNPLCALVFDGNTPTDRVALIGSWDGYVRYLNPDTTDDDGTEIESSVFLGPLLTRELDDVLFRDVQAVMGTESGSVTYEVYVGQSAEEAYASTPVLSGTWNAGRNFTNQIMRAGHALYVKISATGPWAIEAVRAKIALQGLVRRRGR